MNSRQKKYIVWPVVSAASMLLISAGCNSTQEYKYQSVADVAAKSDVKANAAEAPKANPAGETSAGVSNEVQQAAAKSEPADPEVTVADILQSENSFNHRKIKATGRIGKVFTHDKMAFLLNINNDKYIEVSYEGLPESDKSTLAFKLMPLQKVTISGVWDSSRKVLVADGLAI